MIAGSTGEILWAAEKIYGVEGSVFIPDDPDFVVIVEARLPSAVSGLRYDDVSKAPVEEQKKILSQVAIRFYQKEKLLAEHTLADLEIPPAAIPLTISHVYFFESRTERSDGNWDWPLEDLSKFLNPRFNTEDRTMTLFCNDNRIRTFSYQTGKLVSIETNQSSVEKLKGKPKPDEEKSDSNKARITDPLPP